MRKLLRFIKGFLKVKLSGEYAEMLINKASKNGIEFWGLYAEKENIKGFIGLKNFRYLFKLRRQAPAKIKIEKKYGLPFILHRYRKRTGFLVGAVIFFTILEILSLFIWTVDVSGNKKVSKEEILLACKTAGVYEGVKKSKINSKNSADKIILSLEELAWCSVNIEGSVVTVNVTEVKNMPDENDLPSNIVAKEDGIIKKIDVVSGYTVVKVGDVVAKGDLLVSGIGENINSTVFLESRGNITAEIQKKFSATEPFVKTQDKATGKVINHTELYVFGFKIPFYFLSVKGDCFLENEYKRFEISDKKLPFAVGKTKYHLTKKVEIKRDEETVKKLLKSNIEQQIKKYSDKDFSIRDEKYLKTDEGITLEQTVVMVCDIAEQKTVMISNDIK